MDDTKTLIFGIAGVKGAGKSHYLAVLIYELTNRVSARFHASLSPADDLTRRWYNEYYRQPLYVKGRQIPSTPKGRACPLIYQLTFARAPFRRQRTYTLVFFDTAGEHFEDVREMERNNRYLAHAAGLILLLDPLAVKSADPLDLAARIDEIIRSEHALSVHRRISLPVAVTLSKLDVVRSRFSPDSPMHRDSSHDGYFNLRDFRAIDAIIRLMVKTLFGDGLDSFLRRRFKSSAYLAVSSLGQTPLPDGRLVSSPVPFRTEDPLLWLLYESGVIRATTAG